MKPIIGLTTDVKDDGEVSLVAAYSRAVWQAGGIPIAIPYVENTDAYDSTINMCHGIILTGGADIDPQLYGQEKKNTCGNIQKLRDEMEMYILDKAICNKKPILAICRGIQLLNVYFGGTLYQDIPTEYVPCLDHVQKEGKFEPSHSVSIVKDSPLYTLVGKDIMTANSFHHQGIKALGADLEVMAYASDNMIEAVYLKRETYVRGYQWHPERLCHMDENNKKLFIDFINNCKGNKNE
jgi:putative glutamine amidotransferase